MYIVTGGAGFIGNAFVWKLNQEGIDDILIVDSLGCSEKWKNLVKRRYADFIHKDAFYEMLCEGTLPFKAKAVIHMGACSSTTERDADYLMENNFHYSCALARWAVEKKIPFLYASSGATYGDGSLGFSDDDKTTKQLEPINMYGYSKQLFDLWVMRNKLLDKVVGIKFFNVFGPNEYHKGEMQSVVRKSFFQIRDTGKVRLFKSHRSGFGHGEQIRDFVYVKDCVEVMWWFLKNPRARGIFNLGTGKARTWNDLVKAVFKASGVKQKIEYIDMPVEIRDQYQYVTEAKMDKLRKAGCPIRCRSLEDAITDYVTQPPAAERSLFIAGTRDEGVGTRKMQVVVIIPSRYQSTRFMGKPLADVLGKPMIQHVYERVLLSKSATFAAVATDDQRIFEAVEKFGGRVILTSADHPSGTDRIAEAAQKLGLADTDIVVNIQGDQPTFEPTQIDEVVKPLLEDPAVEFSTLIYKIQRDEEITDPNAVKVAFDKDHFALYFSRSTIPFVRDRGKKADYWKHHGIYAYRKSFLVAFTKLPQGTLEKLEALEQLRALEHGYRIKVVETDFDSIEVDTPHDLERVKALMAGKKS